MAEVWRSNHGNGKSHATSSFGPRSLCGRAIGVAWTREQVRDVDDSTVECSRCRNALRIIERHRSDTELTHDS